MQLKLLWLTAGQVCPAFCCGSFSFAKLWLHSQTNNSLHGKWAVTPIWVLNRLPMQP